MSSVLVRYWAAARDAAGTAEESVAAETLADVIEAAKLRHGDDLARILRRCSYLVDESPVGTRDPGAVVLAEGATVEVLPPFAGG